MLDRPNRAGARLAAFAIVAMMFVGAADVVLTRLGRPLAGAFELTESLMVACVFLALAQAQASGGHIRVDVLLRAAGPRQRAALDALAHLLSLALYAAIAAYGWREFGSSLASGEYAAGIVKLALWPARLALAAGATLMSAQTLADFLASLRALHRGARG